LNFLISAYIEYHQVFPKSEILPHILITARALTNASIKRPQLVVDIAIDVPTLLAPKALHANKSLRFESIFLLIIGQKISS